MRSFTNRMPEACYLRQIKERKVAHLRAISSRTRIDKHAWLERPFLPNE